MARGERSESLAPLGRESSGATTETILAHRGFRLEPHGVGEILDVALEVFRQRFFAFVGIAFVFGLCAQQMWEQLTRVSEAMRERGDDVLATALESGALLTNITVGFVVAAATCRLAYGVFEGKPVTVRSLLATVARRLLPLAVTTGLMLALLFVGVLACVLPAIYFTVKTNLASSIVVLERAGPVQALRRSFALTSGLFGLVLGALVLGSLLFAPFQAGAASLQDPLARREVLDALGITPGGTAEWIPTLLFTLLGAVGSAYMAVLGTLLYVEARVRREGFDLYVQLVRVRARHALEVPAARPPTPGGAATAWEGLA